MRQVNRNPLIGVVGKHDEKRESIGQYRRYLDAILTAGGLPVVIYPMSDRALVREAARRLDGILLPGSSTDIEPAIYGATPHPNLGRLYPERDVTDMELLDYADSHSVPTLGVCFGIQSLNVSRGGSLIQDIPALVTAAAAHSLKDSEGGPARHRVRLQEGSLLSSLAGGKTADVNSYHHQSIERVGARLQATAVATDGVIEAVEDTAGRFIVGVQWHPEQDWEHNAFSRALFHEFVARARAYLNSREKAQ